MQPNSLTRLKQEYVTLAESLKTAGYTTAHFGKWHLGPEPYDPLHQGFDVDIPHTSGAGAPGGYMTPWTFPKGVDFPGAPGAAHRRPASSEAVKFIQRE